MAEGVSRESQKPLTVLFADMSGSVNLYAVRGDAEAFQLNSACLDMVEMHIRQHRGKLIRRLGDGVLAVFERGEDAVRAAEGFQNALDDGQLELNQQGVRMRAGISCGPVVLGEGDIYGDIVNVAARLTSLAGPAEILLSGSVYEALPLDLRRSVRLIDQVALRGRPRSVLVYQYLWKQDDMTVSLRPRSPTQASTIEISYGPQLFVVGAERTRLGIGRAPDNTIPVDHDVVSRYHATITLRGDKFVLTDTSTNGTYVHTDRGEIFRLLREDLTLSGSGCILPGSETVDPILYRVCSR